MEGVRAADREIEFIHRLPLSAGTGSGGSTDPVVETMTRASLDTLSGVKKPILTELKFNWSHAHSSPTLVKVHGGDITDTYWNPLPENYRISWMMRNEDFFMLRWGQPDFIREHIRRNGHSYVQGYYVGSECYIPAVDYFSKLTVPEATYAFEATVVVLPEPGDGYSIARNSRPAFVNSFHASLRKGRVVVVCCLAVGQ